MLRSVVPAVLAVLVGSAPALAWGPAAHRAVSAAAVDTLPKGLKAFYKDHRFEMPALSLEGLPDDEESVERRFAIDRLYAFPFAEVAHSEAAFKQKHGEQAAIGRLPWLVQQSYARLVDAFKSGDKAKILAESDVLAGLVADLHNPLALTKNADGQDTNQHGLWMRFSARLPDAAQKKLGLNPDAAHLLDRPDEQVFAILNGSYVWLDNLLYQEDLVRRSSAGFGEIYYDTLERRAGSILRERLSAAAGDVGSYWYTAWTAAGRPALQ